MLIIGPSSEPSGETTPLPVKNGFSHESPLLTFLIDNVEPLIETSSLLSLIHSHDEVTHNSMGLRLHLRDQVGLSGFILLNLDPEVRDLLLVLLLSFIKHLNVFDVDLLSSLGAMKLPNGK